MRGLLGVLEPTVFLAELSVLDDTVAKMRGGEASRPGLFIGLSLCWYFRYTSLYDFFII